MASQLPFRHTAPHPWSPMTEAEWASLAPYLSRGRGRPPADLRALWDAIFWVACSRLPWRALPPGLGRADTAHRALRRAARSGLLCRLLRLAACHPALEWRLCRAWRRAARLMTVAALLGAKRLGLLAALPCPPPWLPQPDLSELARRLGPALVKACKIKTLRLLRRLHEAAAGKPHRFRTTA